MSNKGAEILIYPKKDFFFSITFKEGFAIITISTSEDDGTLGNNFME